MDLFYCNGQNNVPLQYQAKRIQKTENTAITFSKKHYSRYHSNVFVNKKLR